MDLYEIVVHPQYQNRGIGTGVLRDVIAQARGLGLDLQLQVLHENGAARLYERLVFDECERSATHRLMRLGP